MSNHLAIATVTGALNYRLSKIASAALPSASVNVTNLRPNAPSGLPPTGVNIFLYQVTPNVAQRNSDLVTRRSDGTLLKKPTAALDLHYMLSFYGDESQWEPQILLGAVVRAMHAQPSIDSATITAMLGDPLYNALLLTNLMEAPDPVRFTATALTFEEMSKLWGIFYQIPYVLSIAYAASVVLIESDDLPKTTLPVREYQVGAIPFQKPVLEKAASSSNPIAPLVPTDQLVLTGSSLFGGTSREVLIDGAAATVASATSISPTQDQYIVTLPSSIAAGVHAVQLIEHVPVTPTWASVVESNLLTFAVAPVVSSASSTTTATSTDITVDVAANVTPAIGPKQRLQIALAQIASAGGPSYFLEAKIGGTPNVVEARLTSPVPNPPILPGTYVIRVFVEGVPSPLDPTTPYSTPNVVVT